MAVYQSQLSRPNTYKESNYASLSESANTRKQSKRPQPQLLQKKKTKHNNHFILLSRPIVRTKIMTKILVILAKFLVREIRMLLPFDHVTIQDYEFVLHYKHKGPSMFDGNAAGWHAIDTYGNDVCIRQQDVKKLEPFIFKGMTRFEEPTFFKVDDGRWQRVDSEQMHHDINLGHLSGGFTTKDGHSNAWNIQTMTIEDNEDIYTLKILTRGGWWL